MDWRLGAHRAFSPHPIHGNESAPCEEVGMLSAIEPHHLVIASAAEFLAWVFVALVAGLAINAWKSWFVIGQSGIRPLVDDGLGVFSRYGSFDSQSMWDPFCFTNIARTVSGAIAIVGFLRYVSPWGEGMKRALCSVVTGFGGTPPYCG
jgi:hypothetical protein